MDEATDKSLFPAAAGVNEALITPGVTMSAGGMQKLAARAAMVSAVHKYSIPDLIKIASGAALEGSTRCPRCEVAMQLRPDIETRLRAHATLLKFGLGEELTVKIGNELLLQVFIQATAHLIPEDRHEEWKNDLYDKLRSVA